MRNLTARTATVITAASMLLLASCTSSSESGSTTASSAASPSVSTPPAPSAAATGSAAPRSGGSATSSGANTGADPAYVAEVSATVEKVMQDNVIPGSVVLIASPDQGDWTGTFGTGTLGEEEPMTVDDHFRIGSNTKTMTSTVILQLVQEGKLALDDPIGKYIPGVPNGDQITIAQLSEMRSGLYSYSFDPGFNQTLDEQPQKAWTPQELIDIAFTHPVNFAPGAEYDYSNTNIILLGHGDRAADRNDGVRRRSRSGSSTHSGWKTRCSRCRMTRPSRRRTRRAIRSAATPPPSTPTRCPPPTSRPRWTARCCRTTRPTRTRRGAWTAGAAISTVDDMKTYVEALVDGGLLDAATQKIRMDSFQPTDPSNPSAAPVRPGHRQDRPADRP